MFPQQINEKDLEGLLLKVLASDSKSIQLVIEGHIRLAYFIGNEFALKSPRSKRDDIIGVAFLALTRAVNDFSLANQTHNSIVGYFRGYLTVTIKGFIMNHLKEDNIVYAKNGKYITVRSIGEDANDAKDARHIYKFNKRQNFTAKEYPSYMDAIDLINYLATGPYDKIYMQMKLLDYNDSEVASKLGIVQSSLSDIKQAIKIKYLLLDRR